MKSIIVIVNSVKNDKRMKDLNNQRKLDNKNKRQSSLWANAIKMVNFNVYLCRRFYTKSSQIGGKIGQVNALNYSGLTS